MKDRAAGRCRSMISSKYCQPGCSAAKTSIPSPGWVMAQVTNILDRWGWLPSHSKNFRPAWGWVFTQFPRSVAASGWLSAHLSIAASRAGMAIAEGGGTDAAQPQIISMDIKTTIALKWNFISNLLVKDNQPYSAC